MSNPIWSALLGAFKSALNALGSAITDVEQHLASDIVSFGGLVSALLTAEEAQIAMDYEADLKQIAINIQNELPGINLSNFIPKFIEAATPVLATEAGKLTSVFWNVVTTYHATNVGVTTNTGNAGVLTGGNSASTTS
jgi:predicted amino acid-binding ACT domain protein